MEDNRHPPSGTIDAVFKAMHTEAHHHYEGRSSLLEDAKDIIGSRRLLHHLLTIRGPPPSRTIDEVYKAMYRSDFDTRRSPAFVLNFTDLTYTVKNPRSSLDPVTARAPLLDSISGEAREGEIMAVLGASGSGKSTLINVLANRVSPWGSLRGSITLNGESLLDGRVLLKAISAYYAMQDDLLYPMLTVEETLTYAAELRLPRSLSASQKKSRVQALIDQLGLRHLANTIIGDDGVSIGERRRVSIGIDIIHDPIILFLDDPTSGLDSTSAFMVVKVLKRIAHSGSVVIMSVHQPSFRILDLLDRLLFLSRGQTVYSGSTGGLAPFFAVFGRSIPTNQTLTEFALDQIRDLEASSLGIKPLVDFNNSWQNCQASSAQRKSDFSFEDAISASIARGKLVTAGPFASPFWVEIYMLTKRAFTNSRRQPGRFGIRLGAVMVMGFILSTIFWKLDDSPKGVQERIGFFAIAISTLFYTCTNALPVLLHERDIFMRETAAYRRSTYVLSNAIVVLPSLVLLSATFAATTFFPVGLAGGAQGFLFFFLIILASFWAGSGLVAFLSGVVPHVMHGYTVVVAILAYFLLLSGFFVNRDRISEFWIGLHYASPVKYPYEAMLQNEFGDPSLCFVNGLQMFDGTRPGSMPAAVTEGVVRVMSETGVTSGTDVLVQQAVTGLSKWSCLWITVAWGFFFRFLFYVSLLMGCKCNNDKRERK